MPPICESLGWHPMPAIRRAVVATTVATSQKADRPPLPGTVQTVSPPNTTAVESFRISTCPASAGSGYTGYDLALHRCDDERTLCPAPRG